MIPLNLQGHGKTALFCHLPLPELPVLSAMVGRGGYKPWRRTGGNGKILQRHGEPQAVGFNVCLFESPYPKEDLQLLRRRDRAKSGYLRQGKATRRQLEGVNARVEIFNIGADFPATSQGQGNQVAAVAEAEMEMLGRMIGSEPRFAMGIEFETQGARCQPGIAGQKSAHRLVPQEKPAPIMGKTVSRHALLFLLVKQESLAVLGRGLIRLSRPSPDMHFVSRKRKHHGDSTKKNLNNKN